MEKSLSAVFENGVLRPIEPLDLPEHQRVEIIVTVPDAQPVDEGLATHALAAWQSVYDGLTAEEMDEVERIALDRTHFSRLPSSI